MCSGWLPLEKLIHIKETSPKGSSDYACSKRVSNGIYGNTRALQSKLRDDKFGEDICEQSRKMLTYCKEELSSYEKTTVISGHTDGIMVHVNMPLEKGLCGGKEMRSDDAIMISPQKEPSYLIQQRIDNKRSEYTEKCDKSFDELFKEFERDLYKHTCGLRIKEESRFSVVFIENNVNYIYPSEAFYDRGCWFIKDYRREILDNHSEIPILHGVGRNFANRPVGKLNTKGSSIMRNYVFDRIVLPWMFNIAMEESQEEARLFTNSQQQQQQPHTRIVSLTHKKIMSNLSVLRDNLVEFWAFLDSISETNDKQHYASTTTTATAAVKRISPKLCSKYWKIKKKIPVSMSFGDRNPHTNRRVSPMETQRERKDCSFLSHLSKSGISPTRHIENPQLFYVPLLSSHTKHKSCYPPTHDSFGDEDSSMHFKRGVRQGMTNATVRIKVHTVKYQSQRRGIRKVFKGIKMKDSSFSLNGASSSHDMSSENEYWSLFFKHSDLQEEERNHLFGGRIGVSHQKQFITKNEFTFECGLMYETIGSLCHRLLESQLMSCVDEKSFIVDVVAFLFDHHDDDDDDDNDEREK